MNDMKHAKTKAKIDSEIKKLKQYRTNIPTHTFFGEPNLPVIDAEIRALSEEMTEGDAYNAFPIEEGAEESRELGGALYAIQWRDGEEKESPSEGWKPLLKK